MKNALRLPLLLAVALVVEVARPDSPPQPAAGAWLPPDARSDRPAEADWANAEPLALARPHRSCTAKRIREWARVQCKRDPKAEEPYLGIRVVGGSHEDVRVSDPADGKKFARDVAVVFPVRKGDRRVIELVGAQPIPWKSFTVYEKLELVVSEEWLPSEPAPTITVH